MPVEQRPQEKRGPRLGDAASLWVNMQLLCPPCPEHEVAERMQTAVATLMARMHAHFPLQLELCTGARMDSRRGTGAWEQHARLAGMHCRHAWVLLGYPHAQSTWCYGCMLAGRQAWLVHLAACLPACLGAESARARVRMHGMLSTLPYCQPAWVHHDLCMVGMLSAAHLCLPACLPA